MKSRIVFMGSPDFAVPTLSALASEYNVVGVVTQPDRYAGRGRTNLREPAVKIRALELGLPVNQPTSLKGHPESVEQIKTWKPELIVVAAYGQILPPEVLDIPTKGCLNVHASLLPRWRGASPINHAILNGDHETGITIMLMDPGMDTGPILSQQKIEISPNETAGTLFEKLAPLGAKLLLQTIPAYLEGTIKARVQDEALATYAPMLKKSDGALDFSRSADFLARQVRAFNPWPGTYLTWNDRHLKIHQASARIQESLSENPASGERTTLSGFPAIFTIDGQLVLEVVQPAGKKSMSGKEFLQGARQWS